MDLCVEDGERWSGGCRGRKVRLPLMDAAFHQILEEFLVVYFCPCHNKNTMYMYIVLFNQDPLK